MKGGKKKEKERGDRVASVFDALAKKRTRELAYGAVLELSIRSLSCAGGAMARKLYASGLVVCLRHTAYLV